VQAIVVATIEIRSLHDVGIGRSLEACGIPAFCGVEGLVEGFHPNRNLWIVVVVVIAVVIIVIVVVVVVAVAVAVAVVVVVIVVVIVVVVVVVVILPLLRSKKAASRKVGQSHTRSPLSFSKG